MAHRRSVLALHVGFPRRSSRAGPFRPPGSIPELSEDDKVYNSSPTFDKQGNLVAIHRSTYLSASCLETRKRR